MTESKWLPIESAVQDGKPVLICGGTYYYDAETYPQDLPFTGVTIAHWYKGNDEWNGGYGSEYDGQYWHKPTHWMPLPLAPDSSLTFSNEAVSDAVQLNQTFLLSSSDTEVE